MHYNSFLYNLGHFCVFLELVLFLLLFTSVGYSKTAQKSPKPIEPDYENVDVFVERDWGDNENMILATVFDKTDTENPYLLIFKNNGTHQEVLLNKGIIVRIFEHDSGKLLKTYIGSEYEI